MSEPSRRDPGSAPILAPLGVAKTPLRRARDWVTDLPPAAAPVLVTLVGGLAVAIVVAGFMGSEAEDAVSEAPRETTVATTEAAPPQPAARQPEPAQPADTSATLTTADERAAAVPVSAPDVTLASPLFEAAPLDEAAAAGFEMAPDSASTAAIPPAMPGAGTFAPTVAVAETQEDLETLETIQRKEVEADLSAPSGEATSAIQPADAPQVAAKTTRWANLRVGPSDDAEVLEVVPALAIVQAQTDCDWCAVSYEGRNGFMYKTLLSYQ